MSPNLSTSKPLDWEKTNPLAKALITADCDMASRDPKFELNTTSACGSETWLARLEEARTSKKLDEEE
jgi:hypothetical protein